MQEMTCSFLFNQHTYMWIIVAKKYIYTHILSIFFNGSIQERINAFACWKDVEEKLIADKVGIGGDF